MQLFHPRDDRSIDWLINLHNSGLSRIVVPSSSWSVRVIPSLVYIVAAAEVPIINCRASNKYTDLSTNTWSSASHYYLSPTRSTKSASISHSSHGTTSSPATQGPCNGHPVKDTFSRQQRMFLRVCVWLLLCLRIIFRFSFYLKSLLYYFRNVPWPLHQIQGFAVCLCYIWWDDDWEKEHTRAAADFLSSRDNRTNEHAKAQKCV